MFDMVTNTYGDRATETTFKVTEERDGPWSCRRHIIDANEKLQLSVSSDDERVLLTWMDDGVRLTAGEARALANALHLIASRVEYEAPRRLWRSDDAA
jgi:hypothetical protein